jgi:hypothetical protein
VSLINGLGLALSLLIVASLVASAVRGERHWARYRLDDLADPSKPLPYERPLWPRLPGQEVTHLTADHDAPLVTQCCGLPLLALLPGDPFTSDPQKVTCRVPRLVRPVTSSCDESEP